jgi:hypothetical protein
VSEEFRLAGAQEPDSDVRYLEKLAAEIGKDPA